MNIFTFIHEIMLLLANTMCSHNESLADGRAGGWPVGRI